MNIDQPMFAPSSMAGFILLHQRIPRRVARREGISLGFEGETLLDFVDIVRRIDALEWGANFQRQAKALAEGAKKNVKKKSG